MKHLLQIALVSFLATALSACAPDTTEKDQSSEDELNAQAADDFQKSLSGTWTKPCQFHAGFNQWYIEALQFQYSSVYKTSMTVSQTWYTGANCSGAYLYRKQYREIDGLQKDGNNWVFQANSLGQTVTVLTQPMTVSFNSDHTCGISTWVQNVESPDVSTSNCAMATNIIDALYINPQTNALYRAMDEATSSANSAYVPTGLAYIRIQ